MKIVKFSKIDGRSYEEGEDDVTHLTETTKPWAIPVENISDFYPRKGDLVGTRIVMKNGRAMPVKETFDQVYEAITAAVAA